MHQHSRKMSNRTNTQMMISFAQNEAHLADQLAQIAKKKHYTKSGWIKEQIHTVEIEADYDDIPTIKSGVEKHLHEKETGYWDIEIRSISWSD